MQATSRQVSSGQRHLHPKLPALLRRHLTSPLRKPATSHNLQAFGKLLDAIAVQRLPLVLDSFCGTGRSTALLARRHPGHLVVGIDKSANRLARHRGGPSDNYLLLRAECEAIWQLLAARGITVDHHYLLYPNPWPKTAHLQRRVHGHAAFPWLLQLAGTVELRSNWQLYVEEFGLAMFLAGYPGRAARLPVGRAGEDTALTLFEQKYRDSGHDLWVFTGNIRPAPPGRPLRDEDSLMS